MAVSYTTTLENNRLDEVTAAAGGAAYLQIWDGAVPATPDADPAGNILASLAMTVTNIAPAATGGVLTMSTITDDTNAAVTGIPTFARIATTATGRTDGVAQMTAGVAAGDIDFDASIVATGTVSVGPLTITHG